MSHPVDPRPGSRLGIPDRVSPGWSGYARGEVERHAREVHYEVLRESRFDRDHAAHLADSSSDAQARLLEEHRGEHRPTARPVEPRREPPAESRRAPDDLFGAFLRTLGGPDGE